MGSLPGKVGQVSGVMKGQPTVAIACCAVSSTKSPSTQPSMNRAWNVWYNPSIYFWEFFEERGQKGLAHSKLTEPVTDCKQYTGIVSIMNGGRKNQHQRRDGLTFMDHCVALVTNFTTTSVWQGSVPNHDTILTWTTHGVSIAMVSNLG
jgi:hypothetical protein